MDSGQGITIIDQDITTRRPEGNEGEDEHHYQSIPGE